MIKCLGRHDSGNVLGPEKLLKDLESFLSSSFKDAIVWEQRDADLLGKYVYVKYDGEDIGIFMGYQTSPSGSVRGAITFLFSHPMSPSEESHLLGRLFHKLLIRLNLQLRVNPYKMVSGKLPAIIRTTYFSENDVESGVAQKFFRESVRGITRSEPLYRAASL